MINNLINLVGFNLKGLTQDSIAQRLHVRKHRVNSTFKRFRETGYTKTPRKREVPHKQHLKKKEFIDISTLINVRTTNKSICQNRLDKFHISLSLNDDITQQTLETSKLMLNGQRMKIIYYLK